jgi:hypothetical protein
MRHRVVVEVEMILEEQDQGYAATEAEQRLLRVKDVTRVIVQKSQKESTGNEPSNYGRTPARTAAPAKTEPVRRDPGVNVTMVK